MENGSPHPKGSSNAATKGHSSIVVSCGASGPFEESHRLRVLIGEGRQTVKWLALTAAQMLTARQDTHGRVQARAPVGDGRLSASCLPTNVFVSRQKKWVHPHTRLHDLITKYGRSAHIFIELELRPNQENGCHVRTVWGDLAFGGDKGEERYQNWVAERRARGVHNAMSDDEEDMNEEIDDSGSTEGLSAKELAKKAEQALKAEFDLIWSQVRLSHVIAVEAEKTRIHDYVYPHFNMLKMVFQRYALAHVKASKQEQESNDSTSATARGETKSNVDAVEACYLLLPDVIHFSWQHELDMCCTGLRRTAKDPSKVMSNQMEEEAFVRACAEEVMLAQTDGALHSPASMNRNSSGGDEQEKVRPEVSLSLPNFIEFLIRYTVRMKEGGKNIGASGNQTKGPSGGGGSYALAIALRQMLQRLIPICNRRENEKIRKVITSKSISRIFAESIVPVRQVFDHYATAELQKDRQDDRYKGVLFGREFRLLMTDSLLIGSRPGDDSVVARADCAKSFYSAQANDGSSAVAFSAMTKEERAGSSNVLEDITFAEFLEAVSRVALAKWDDDEIPHLDKIQLALEAVAVMAA